VPERYRLTEVAAADFDALAGFSLTSFGPAQAKRYADGLFKTLDLLVAFPQMGSDHGHVLAGMRRVVHGSHSIYYVVIDDEIVVLGFLGAGQDPLQRFARESDEP
jgi:toxin ParE1/3/4